MMNKKQQSLAFILPSIYCKTEAFPCSAEESISASETEGEKYSVEGFLFFGYCAILNGCLEGFMSKTRLGGRTSVPKYSRFQFHTFL